MAISRKIAQWISDYLALIVLAVAIIALTFPQTFIWMPKSSINWLLGAVMFGMGLTLKPVDFKLAVLRPLPVIVGCAAQFIIMPSVAWLLCKVFSLPVEIASGVILVGCCPGGTTMTIYSIEKIAENQHFQRFFFLSTYPENGKSEQSAVY